jgi:hypothetical protein
MTLKNFMGTIFPHEKISWRLLLGCLSLIIENDKPVLMASIKMHHLFVSHNTLLHDRIAPLESLNYTGKMA